MNLKERGRKEMVVIKELPHDFHARCSCYNCVVMRAVLDGDAEVNEQRTEPFVRGIPEAEPSSEPEDDVRATYE